MVLAGEEIILHTQIPRIVIITQFVPFNSHSSEGKKPVLSSSFFEWQMMCRDTYKSRFSIWLIILLLLVSLASVPTRWNATYEKEEHRTDSSGPVAFGKAGAFIKGF